MASRYLQSYAAFFLSGVFYYVAAETSVPLKRCYGTWIFFLLQPNLILFEGFIIWFGKEKLWLQSPKWRILGYV